MESNERLQIYFTSHPFSFSSMLVVDENPVAQSTFLQTQCTKAWVGALQAIAKATKTSLEPIASQYQSPSSTFSRTSPQGLDNHHRTSDRAHPATKSRTARKPFVKSNEVTVNDPQAGAEIAPSASRDSRSSIRPQIGDNLTLGASSPSSSADTYVTATAHSPTSTGRHNSRVSPSMLSRSSTMSNIFNSAREASITNTTPAALPQPVNSPMTSIMASPTTTVEPAKTFVKRMRKLETLIDSIREHVKPSREEHNEKVINIYNSRIYVSHIKPASMEHLGRLLGELGKLSNALGIIYSLLSWEVYRREEKRLVAEDNLSPKWAAKQINDYMSEQSSRQGRIKDWASDRRRAAGMVFNAMAGMGSVAKSFAILLLADLTTLDGLVKISHFPALRERFTVAFREIHQSQQQRWGDLADKGFQVFDFEEFLRTRKVSRESQANSLSSDFELPELTHSNTSSSPQREPIDVLGKRQRTTDSGSLYSAMATPITQTEQRVAEGQLRDGSVHYGNNSVNHEHLIGGMDEHFDSYLFNDTLNNFASLQNQDLDMLFLTEFDNSLLEQAQ